MDFFANALGTTHFRQLARLIFLVDFLNTRFANSNTSANPIAGTFANLADGSTLTVGRNNYEVSYEGGDGNDLTLTVVQ